MKYRVGNKYSTKMTKNNVLNKEYKNSLHFPYSTYSDGTIQITLEYEDKGIHLRLSQEELKNLIKD